MTRMSRRLAEVARKVGVSEATVSRVLNGKPGVSESTREAVLTALDVLGYERPTKLRGERARLVGLVLPELQNPIFPAFAEVVGGALAQQGFTPVLCTQTAGGVSEADYVELLLGQQVSGIVFAGGHYAQRDATHDHYERLTGRNLPVVLINASIEELPFPRVSCDDEVAIEQAIGHLASLGHTTIGLVLGPVDHVPSVDRDDRLDAPAGVVRDAQHVALAHLPHHVGLAGVLVGRSRDAIDQHRHLIARALVAQGLPRRRGGTGDRTSHQSHRPERTRVPHHVSLRWGSTCGRRRKICPGKKKA